MIEILLATYNGEKFLQEQLDSILHQTFQDWCIVAHDDGSTDATLGVLQQFQHEHPSKIKVLDDGLSFGSARDNFEHLLKHATADYIMLCDQDDVWMHDKIVQTLSAMKKAEYQNPHKPVLIHTDLTVVDEELDVIAPSMFAYQRLKKNSTLKNLMVRNSVTGCTLMLNQQALICALPIPKQAMMHDWWLVLKVKETGVVGFVDRPTMYYRQHGKNCLGAVEINLAYYLMHKYRAVSSDKRASFSEVIEQAKALSNPCSRMWLYLQKYSMILQSILYLGRFSCSPERSEGDVWQYKKGKVVVLLSSYCGSDYLKAQIQSIQAQSFQDWKLLIRDDGSTDQTYKLLEELQKNDARIHLLPAASNVGVIRSFSLLAEEGARQFPDVNWFMFADQDDIWLPLKIEKTLECMQRLELQHDYALVHTDLEVVDDNLSTIGASFMKFQHVRHEENQALEVLLTQNFVTGCTVMVNRKLLEIAAPVPKDVMMHDWWLALCAASIGKISFVNQPTMLYRQHQGNSVGAKGFWKRLLGMLFSEKEHLTRRERFMKVYRQTKALQLLLQEKCFEQTAQYEAVSALVKLPPLSCFQRMTCVRSLQIKPQFWVRKLAFWWDLIRMPKQDKW